MTKANCPSCGAPIQFRWSNAVQTVCEYCRSVLVRHDLDLERVGQVASIPDDASPIQLGAEGIYRNRAFQVIGRIVYEYEQGSWNEWHLIFNDGQSGWLSDAQLEYAVSLLTKPPGTLPPYKAVKRDNEFNWNGTVYQVTTITQAHYVGVEGELPFEYWDKEDLTFVDLRSRDGRFGTIDYSEDPPLLFLGEAIEYDDLRLKNAREFEGWPR
jgi:hypothetical protein